MNTKAFLVFVLLAALRHSLSAGELTISSPSIGGVTSSAGGSFSVRGKIGEPSPAGTSLTGGSFSLSGFISSIAVLPTPGSPSLTLSRTQSGYEVSWPLPADGFILQEATALGNAGPSAWANSSVSPTDQNGRRVVALPAVGPMRFFRLIKPAP